MKTAAQEQFIVSHANTHRMMKSRTPYMIKNEINKEHMNRNIAPR